MMRTLCEKQLKDASKDDLLRLIGYFVYYRFINVALVSPEAFKVRVGPAFVCGLFVILCLNYHCMTCQRALTHFCFRS